MSIVTLTGTLTNTITGAPRAGKGYIKATAPVLVDMGANKVLLGGQPFVLDVAGAFSVPVRATDDVDLTPVNFTYELTLELDNDEVLSLTFYAPAAVPTLDLSDFQPVSPTAGTVVPIGQITVSTTAPTSPYINQLWAPA